MGAGSVVPDHVTDHLGRLSKNRGTALRQRSAAAVLQSRNQLHLDKVGRYCCANTHLMILKCPINGQ